MELLIKAINVCATINATLFWWTFQLPWHYDIYNMKCKYTQTKIIEKRVKTDKMTLAIFYQAKIFIIIITKPHRYCHI